MADGPTLQVFNDTDNEYNDENAITSFIAGENGRGKVVSTGLSTGKISPTLYDVGAIPALSATYTAGEDITAFQAIYLDNETSEIQAKLARADSADTLAHGIALTAATSGNNVLVYLLRPVITIPTGPDVAGLTVGERVFLSTTTAGAMSSSISVAEDQYRQPLGVYLGHRQIMLGEPSWRRRNNTGT